MAFNLPCFRVLPPRPSKAHPAPGTCRERSLGPPFFHMKCSNCWWISRLAPPWVNIPHGTLVGEENGWSSNSWSIGFRLKHSKCPSMIFPVTSILPGIFQPRLMTPEVFFSSGKQTWQLVANLRAFEILNILLNGRQLMVSNFHLLVANTLGCGPLCLTKYSTYKTIQRILH